MFVPLTVAVVLIALGIAGLVVVSLQEKGRCRSLRWRLFQGFIVIVYGLFLLFQIWFVKAVEGVSFWELIGYGGASLLVLTVSGLILIALFKPISASRD